MKTLGYKLWSWLYKLSKKSIKRSILNRYHNDIKCPNCREWFSVSGVEYKHTHTRTPDTDLSACTCGQCGYTSYWSPFIAPFPVLTDEKGNPL